MLTTLIELLPKKLYAVALAAAIALCAGLGVAYGVEALHAGQLTTQLAQTKGQYQAETAARERVAREDAQEVARMGAKHASTQQEIVHAFHAQQGQEAARRAADSADLDLMRDVVRTYAAGGGSEGGSDTAACRDLGNRSQRLGGLVQEALGLSLESESFIRQRDREVTLLKGVITNDRTLTPEGPK